MQPLGESWDVVEVVRSLSQVVGLLTTEVDSLQKIVAGQEARLQVLEPRPLIQVGTLVVEDQADAVCLPGQAGVSREGEGGEGRRAKRSFAQFRRPFPLFVGEVGMEILLRDAWFWVALLLLIRSVLFYAVPAFPSRSGWRLTPSSGSCWASWRGNNVVQMRRAANEAVVGSVGK